MGKVDNHSTLKFHLEIYERIEETVAVLLINNSSELELNPQLCIPDFQIHIPVYITSANNQQILENCTHCEFFDSTNEHQGLCMNAGASVTTFLEYLNTYIFPDGESPVTISEDYTLFQQITDAVINKEQLLKVCCILPCTYLWLCRVKMWIKQLQPYVIIFINFLMMIFSSLLIYWVCY